MTTPAQPRIKIFFSYAHKDEDLVDLCRGHLIACDSERLTQVWHDRQIPPGAEWKGVIDRNLSTSHVVVLFISHHFLQSEYCRDVEMTEALERHRTGAARVIPVILRPCGWQEHRVSMLQVLPVNAKPITTWDNPDEAALNVARGIMTVVGAVPPQTTAPAVEPDITPGPRELAASSPVRSDLGNVHCNSAACQSAHVRLTELPVVIESIEQADQGGWIAHGQVRVQHSIVGECLTCGRIFDVVKRAIPLQFSDLPCRQCGEQSHLEYHPTGFRMVDGAYEFGVEIRCSECAGTRTLTRSLPSLLRTTGIEVGLRGIKVQESVSPPDRLVEA